ARYWATTGPRSFQSSDLSAIVRTLARYLARQAGTASTLLRSGMRVLFGVTPTSGSRVTPPPPNPIPPPGPPKPPGPPPGGPKPPGPPGPPGGPKPMGPP